MDIRRARPGWWQALCAAAIALAVDGLYLAIIRNEGEGELRSGRVLFVAGCLAGAALLLVGGLVVSSRARAILFTAATTLLAIWSFLGAFSIGLLLVPAAVFAALATGRARAVGRREAVLAVVGAVVLVAAGISLT